MKEDPREAAAQYRLDREARERGEVPDSDRDADASGEGAEPRVPNAAERAAYVETVIQQAIRRGDFEDLPGSGRPLAGLGDTHDPDWWIRRKIEREKLRGLGPPAIMLRVENAELEDRLDALTRESDVRETLEDFNKRVIEARRQLLGGPPVVTPTRDVEAEVRAWHERRAARAAAASAARAAEEAEMRGRRRGRGRRRERRRRGE